MMEEASQPLGYSSSGIGHNQPPAEERLSAFYSNEAVALADKVTEASKLLGATQNISADGTARNAYVDLSLESIIAAGERLPRRQFHVTGHFNNVLDAVNSEELEWAFQQYKVGEKTAAIARAIMTRAVAHHDVVYFHSDQQFAPGVYPVLDPYIAIDAAVDENQKSTGKAQLLIKADAPRDPVFNAALKLFGLKPGDVLSEYNNQNEFLSAVYAGVRGVQAGIPFQYVVAEMAMIEATVPWGPADRFNQSKRTLTEINEALRDDKEKALKGQVKTDPLTDEELNACMAGAVAIANTDVKGITSLKDFYPGTFSILREMGVDFSKVDSLRKGIGKHIQGFLIPKQEAFKKKQEDLKGKPAAVFHHYPDLPLREDVGEREKNSHRSFGESQRMLEAIVVASALGEDVRSGLALPRAADSVRENFDSFADAFANIEGDARGKIQLDGLSPFAAQVYTLYRKKPEQLRALAQSVYGEADFKPEISRHVAESLQAEIKLARVRGSRRP